MQWDIFCQVIDNFGDIGICWRLSADLASRGEQVRLWVDDPSALAWMAPDGRPGVQVRPWTQPIAAPTLATLTPADVWIEAFGCTLPPEFIAQGTASVRDGARPPVWINLEYLSAEAYVARSHALPSPVREAPAAGGVKWFFYPGFTAGTGGLLREPDLLQRRARFDRAAWLAALAPRLQHEPLTAPPGATPNRHVSLFCYEPAALAGLLRQLDADATPTQLLVTSGRASAAVQAVLKNGLARQPLPDLDEKLSISYLPPLTQHDYDHLLWACDFNFVRGEDSILRALWAGQPFVWQLYPQDDGVHHDKLDAFLDVLEAPASLRRAHHAWNGNDPAAKLPNLAENADEWRQVAERARSSCLRQDDLTRQLLQFVLEKR